MTPCLQQLATNCKLKEILADFTWEVIELACEIEVRFLLLEQLEDLGRLAKGRYKGQRPASMWQWPQFRKVLASYPVATLALHQSSFVCQANKAERATEFPDFMCQWIAFMLLESCTAAATTAQEGDTATGEDPPSYPICGPEGPRTQGGRTSLAL